MIELELLTQAAASVASVPNAPLLLELAEIGFAGIRNARIQRTLGQFEIERAAQRAHQRRCPNPIPR